MVVTSSGQLGTGASVQGPAGVSGYQMVQQTLSVGASVAPGDSVGGFVTCPAGKKVIGGGGYGSGYSVLQRSAPNGDSSWWVIVKNVDSVARDLGPVNVCV